MLKALKKKRKLGNKGFSLVELIIVIAIMAVLVAILAPQYLKYVDKSRQSADDANADQILTAVQVAMADEDVAEELTDDMTITMDSDGVDGATEDGESALEQELLAALGTGWTDKAVTSNTYRNSDDHSEYTVTITVGDEDTDSSVTGEWGGGGTGG